MRISDWSSDVCSSDLPGGAERRWPRNACGRARLPAFAERAGLAAGRAGIQPGRADTGTTGRLGGAATATGRRADAQTACHAHVTRHEIGRAHVSTPVTHAHLVCRLLLEKTKTIHTK